MAAYYAESVRTFLTEPTTSIVGKLSEANAGAHFLQYSDATLVWRDTIDQLRPIFLQLSNSHAGFQEWGVILEYPIPRRQKRIDLVLLGPGAAYVVEFKTKPADRAAVEQVEDYAMDLRDFHEPSSSLEITPIVVSLTASPVRFPDITRGETVFRCSFHNFPSLLTQFTDSNVVDDPIDIREWNEGAYRPVPPIIQAAQSIFGGMEVREVAHSQAGDKNLTRTVDAIYSVVDNCRRRNRKAAVFVTGIPGSGKTLAGLRAVHDPRLVEVAGSEATFLSGNGPLVSVLREALVRDFRKRLQIAKRTSGAQGQKIGSEKSLVSPPTGSLPRIVHEATRAPKDEWKETKKKLERKVRTLIESVHVFARFAFDRDDAPNNHVVVFDEAQRAWDAPQNKKKFSRDVSEPEMLLRIMDRHNWAVIIALVGGGQEINDGEAGLLQWGSALKGYSGWDVVCSPYVLSNEVEDRFQLTNDSAEFEGRLTRSPELHLDVATRAIKARNTSLWVDAVLRGDDATAQGSGAAPPITRDLNLARKWLSDRRKGTERSGLVGSASADRLRVDGLEPSYAFHSNLKWDLWFLNPPEDVRSSSKLEIFATQFEIQGLELDWVGVCWGEDLAWSKRSWSSHNFNHYHWKPNLNNEEHRYRVNGYRVLLTRARRGMVIYLPKAPADDVTRLPASLDATYEFLLSCGAQPL